MLASIVGLLSEGGEVIEAPSNPVIPDLAELFWGALFFLTLLVLMRYVLLPPMQKMMRAREDAERDDLEAAERSLAEAEKVRRDYDQTIAEARSAAARLLDEARAEADAKRSELVSAAEAKVAEARTTAMAEISGARQAALAQANADVASLAATAASKVLGRSVSASDASSIVDELMAQVK